MSDPELKLTGYPEEMIERFPRPYVKQHMLLVITFTTLLITGLPLLAPKFFLFRWIFSTDGVFQARSFIHRLAGVIFILQCLYHAVFLVVNRTARRDLLLVLPRPRDGFDALGMVLYNLGLKKKHPKFGRFSFIEKFEYLALIWGSFVMILTGIVLWGNQALLKFFPKLVFDLSTVIHGFEAILAGLAIVIWHMYTVHFHPDFFPMSRVWLDGNISKENLKKHHYLEYVEIMKARGEPVEPEEHDDTPAADRDA